MAITLGDPAGIGPEVAIKAVASLLAESAEWRDALEFHGDAAAFQDVAHAIEADGTSGESVQDVEFIPASSAVGGAIVKGQVSAAAGDAAYRAIRSALTRVDSGRVAGLVTAPISKAALNLAGHHYPGHTELLAEFAGGVPVRMMLANQELAVVLVTIHLPLKEALSQLSTALIADTIRITARALERYGTRAPKLAVAGLNPHAGEDGLLGQEEIEMIAPAISLCQQEGIDVSGPYPPDTIFMKARRSGAYDAVIAQYHDQGLIPVKYLGVEHGVNITLGLPFIRTSPDHGTAFDIAGQGKADPSSMIAAIRKAAELTRNRRDHE